MSKHSNKLIKPRINVTSILQFLIKGAFVCTVSFRTLLSINYRVIHTRLTIKKHTHKSKQIIFQKKYLKQNCVHLGESRFQFSNYEDGILYFLIYVYHFRIVVNSICPDFFKARWYFHQPQDPTAKFLLILPLCKQTGSTCFRLKSFLSFYLLC